MIKSLRLSQFGFSLFLTFLILTGINESWGANFFRSTTTTANFNSGTAWNSTTNCGAGGTSWPTTSADAVTINCASKTTNPSTTMACGSFVMSNGTFNLSSGTLTVFGNFSLTGGTFNLNGGTLIIHGNFSKTGGTFTHTSGTINFAGTTATQTISSNTTPLTFYNLTISGNQNRSMSQNVRVTNLLTLTGGTLSVNNFKLEMGTSSTGAGVSVASGRITTTSSSQLSFGGNATLTLGSILSNTWPVTLHTFEMTRNLATVTLGTSQSLTVTNAFTLTAGDFVIGANTLTLNGSISGGINGQVTGGPNSDLVLGTGSGSASMYFDLSSSTSVGGTNTIRNLTNNRTASTFTMLSSLRVSNTLSQPSSSSSITISGGSVQTLYIHGDLTGSGRFIGNTNAYLEILGSGALTSPVTLTSNFNLSSLTINRSGNPTILLGSNVTIGGSVVMTAGSLDINGYTISLGANGRLFNETATNRIFCSTCSSVNDGRITATSRTLAANTTYDNTNTTNWDEIGRIGVYITTGATAPGNTTISRGFYSRSGGALLSSINRFFEITPTTNASLNATLQLNYYTAELNGITEANLGMYREASGGNLWTLQSPSTLNTSSDFISKSGIAGFSTWTAGSASCTTPLNGTKTVGGTAPDYADFTAAVNALIACGVDGPVVFNVRTGTYTEQISIPEIAGASSTNTITFQSETGDRDDVVLSHSSSGTPTNNFTLQLSSADYFRFKDMTIQRSGGSTYACVVSLAGSAMDNRFINNMISGRVGSGSLEAALVLSDDTDTGNSDNIFDGNYFLNGSAGIWYESASGSLKPGLTVQNNVFESYRYGMYLEYLEDVTITGNSFSHSPTIFNSASTQGIYAFHVDNDLTISRNTFDYNQATNNDGIELQACFGSVSAVGDISNNMIVVGGTGTVNGINSGSTTSYKNYYYNSVYNTGTNATSSSCYYQNGSTNINLKNNSFFSTVGNALEILAPTSGLVSSDYNNLYSTGVAVGNWGGSNSATIAAWRTASSKDANSISVDPQYLSATDLHGNTSSGMANGGNAIAGIITDIDGDARDASTPDIGADEFSSSCTVPTITGTTAAERCGPGGVTLTATVSAGTISWYNDPTAGTLLGTGSSFNTGSIPNTATYYVEAEDNGCVSASRSAVTATIKPIPTIPSVTHNSRCGAGTVTIGATASAGTLNWYEAISGGPSVGTGTSFTTPVISVNTTYFVDATHNGCTTTVREAVGAGVNDIPTITGTTPASRCGTGTVSLGATASAGTISWFTVPSGGAVQGTGASFTTPSISSTTTYYVEATDNGCISTPRTAVDATVTSASTITWTAGAVSITDKTDWFNADNWTCNIVPDATKDVIIPDGVSHYPVLTGVVNAFTKDLSIDANATISITGAAELEVNGALNYNSGTAAIGDGSIILKGATATGDFTIGTLTIDRSTGVALAAGTDARVSKKLILQSGTFTVPSTASLTLLSSAAETAFVNDFGANTGSYSGNITLQRYIPITGTNAFHYIGAASGGTAMSWNDDFINSATASDGTKVTPKPNCDPLALAQGSAYGNLFSYDESLVTTCYQDGWRVRTTAASAGRGNGFAASVNGGALIDETGAYTKANVTLSNLSITAANSVLHSKGYHLVANPFFAPLDWNAMAAVAGNNNMDATAYIYDPTSGTYTTYNMISSEKIATNMGFFVRGLSGPFFNVTFDADTRIDADNSNFMRQGAPYEYGLRITADNGQHSDETLVVFDENFTDGYDNGFDATKLLSNYGVPSLFTKDAANERKAIEALGFNTEIKSVPLGLLVPGANGSYTLTFEGVAGFPQTAIIWLEDLQTGTIQYLRQDSVYSFTANENDNPDRFVLHFAPQLLIAATGADCSGNNGTIELEQHGGIEWSFILKDAAGATLASDVFDSTQMLNNLLPGNYTVELMHGLSGYAIILPAQVSGLQPVTSAISASVTDVLENESLTLEAQTTGATNYTWDMGDGTTFANQQVISHAYVAEGIYEVSLFAENDACNALAEIQVTVTKEQVSTGIDAPQEGVVLVYEHDKVLYLSQTVSREAVVVQFTLFNALGQQVMTSDIREMTYGTTYTIAVRDVAPGMYFASLKLKNGAEVTRKVMLGEGR